MVVPLLTIKCKERQDRALLAFSCYFRLHELTDFSLLKPHFVVQIRTLGMLRSRFESVPLAFRKRLVPRLKGETKQGSAVVLFTNEFLVF